MRGQTEDRLMIALRHPMRREILRAMAGEPRLSPRQISDRLEEPLSKISYHVRVLREHGAIKLVEQAQVRGSVQHFYRMEVDEPWALAMLGLTKGTADTDGRA